MRILLDMDGCAYQYVPTFADILSEVRGQPRETFPEAESWNFPKQPGWDMTSAEFVVAMEDAIINHDLFHRGPAYPDFEWAVNELAMQGHAMVVATARCYKPETYLPAVDQTERWLDERGLLYLMEDVIVITSATKKSAVAKDYNINVAIDDGPHHYTDLIDNDLLCMLYDQPWNRDLETPNRISGWIEFVMTVGKLG